MENFCRLCAEIREPFEIITSIYDLDKSIEQKFIACCQWNVEDATPNLPQGVCIFISDKLEESWQFSQNVRLSQLKLNEIFSETKPSLVPPPPAILDATFGYSSNSFSTEYQDCIDEPQCFQCDICCKTFKTKTILQTHCKRQNELKCDICSQVFCKVTKFKKHKEEECKSLVERTDIPESDPAFVDCSSKLELKVEPDLDSGHSLDTVEMANQTFSELSSSEPYIAQILPSLEKKKSKKTKQRKRYQKKKYTIDDCIAMVDGEPHYYCYLCFRRLNKFLLLKGHMVVHTYPHRFKCTFCNAKFQTERHFNSHQKKHVEYFCDICNKKCESAFTLKLRAVDCSISWEILETIVVKSSKKVHKRMHVGSSGKMYGCKECDHFFVNISAFYNHMRRKHGLETAAAKKRALYIEPNGTTKPYVCEQCGKDFKGKSALQAHSVIHLDIRPFACDLCPKTFKNKYLLKTHKVVHTKSRSVQCTECGKVYSCKAGSMIHMEEHTGVYRKLFNCDFCDRTFRNPYNMQNHRRTHTGERPYRCEVCNFNSTTITSHERHLKTISHMNKLNEIVFSNQKQNVSKEFPPTNAI